MVEMGEYISIAEAAKKVGISYQAVYKKLKKQEFQGFVREIDGKKYLSETALHYFQREEKVNTDNKIDLPTALLEKVVVRVAREHVKVIEKKIDVLIELERQNQLRLQRLLDSLELKREFEIGELKYKEKEKKFMGMCSGDSGKKK